MKASFLSMEVSSSPEPFKTQDQLEHKGRTSHNNDGDGDDVQIHLLLEYIQFEVLQPIIPMQAVQLFTTHKE